jgi:hypothetical protein
MTDRGFISNINFLVLVVLFMISLLAFNCYSQIKEQELLLLLKVDNLTFSLYGVTTKY